MTITVTVGYRGDSLEDRFVMDGDGEIRRRGLLTAADAPPAWLELQGLERRASSFTAMPRTVLAIGLMILRMAWAAGGGLPLLYVCSREHARAMLAIGRRAGVAVAVLRGSLREGNPYPPLRDMIAGSGSDDEHILKLTLAPCE